MLDDWKKWLLGQGAIWGKDSVLQYGDDAPLSGSDAAGNRLVDLSHTGLISVRGSDARDFLQSQCSNDVDLVTESQAQLNAYCSPKGRILGIFLLFQQNDTFYLQLPQDILDAVLQRLRMFVMRSDVTLEDASGERVRFGLSGSDAQDLLTPLMGTIPEAMYSSAHQDDVSCIRIPGTAPRFELYGPLATMKTHWETLAATAAKTGASAWALADIQAGIPAVTAATSDAFVPQMANLDLVDAVSFTKGCYPGQEIVARMKYLGKLKRRMYLGRIIADQTPKAGDEMFPVSGKTAQAAGKIVSVQAHPEGGYAALAVLKIADAETGVRLGSAEGPEFKTEELPYAISAE